MVPNMWMQLAVLNFLYGVHGFPAVEVCNSTALNTGNISNAINASRQYRDKIWSLYNTTFQTSQIKSEYSYINQRFHEAFKAFEKNHIAKPCLNYIDTAFHESIDISINEIMECCLRFINTDPIYYGVEELQEELDTYLNHSKKCPSKLNDLLIRADALRQTAANLYVDTSECKVYAQQYVKNSNEESKTYFESCILEKTKKPYKIELTKPHYVPVISTLKPIH